MKLEIGLDPVVFSNVLSTSIQKTIGFGMVAKSPFENEALRCSVRRLRQIVQPSERLPGVSMSSVHCQTPIAFGMAATQIIRASPPRVEDVLQRRDRERGCR
jgi:hypothetical protein